MTDYFKLASPANPTDREPLTLEQQDTVDDVLDAAEAWETGAPRHARTGREATA